MAGKRLELVIETVHFLVEQLGEGDYLGLTSYASDVREDLPIIR